MLDHQGFMGVDWENRINYEKLRNDRLQRAKDSLADSDVDVLFVFHTEDSRYLTGVRSHLGPTYANKLTTVLPKGGEPILFTMDDYLCRESMTWMDSEQIQPRAVVGEEVGVKQWAELLEGLIGSLDGKRIGWDVWTPLMEKCMKIAFPNSEFVDGSKIMERAKLIKTKEEIDCLKAATVMTECAMEAAIEFLKPGVKECEVLAVAWHEMTRLGSEWTQCANIVASGPYTAPYRRFTSDRIILRGDPVIIDIGACFNGYWGDFTRTWICGDIKPTDAQIKLHMKAYNDVWNACGAARPGNTTADVVKAAEPLFMNSLGHGSGLTPWELPYFNKTSVYTSPMELKAGMTANLEPYAGEPGIGGFRLENNLVVTENGPDIYTKFPFDERLVTDVHELDSSTGRTRI